ncbi:hypothetical protein BGX26_005066, partial [Mortierella sp. AD094]
MSGSSPFSPKTKAHPFTQMANNPSSQKDEEKDACNLAETSLPSKADQKKFRMSLVEMIASSNQPLSLLENSGIHNM